MTLRELLNKHKWHLGDLEQLELSVAHRGAPGDQRMLRGEDIVDVGPQGLQLLVDPEQPEWEADVGDECGGTVFIPYHRVLSVRGPGGLLWAKPASSG